MACSVLMYVCVCVCVVMWEDVVACSVRVHVDCFEFIIHLCPISHFLMSKYGS